MKKALISPLEPRESGFRVVDIADVAFDVTPDLFWVDCSDEINIDDYYYVQETGEFLRYL